MYSRVLAAGAAVVMCLGLTSAVQSQPRRPAAQSGPYLPLNEADALSIGAGVGCSCTLVAGERPPFRDLMLLAGNALTTRTRAGRETCRVSEAQVERINSGRTTVLNCNARRLSIRISNTTAGGNDDSGSDARVMVSEGRRSTEIRGAWACAC